MELRPYQWEVIMPALEGKNIIIWLPTGAGKTRAAAYVAKRHLETVDGAKVVVLVNRVHLVTQHREEFSRMLGKRWTITTLSGDMGPRAGFGHLARSHDLLICTAELLQMALTSPEEEEHVELNAFSLLVVDECHHTHKDTVYNIILSRYLEQKLQRTRPLPQVLGLTASPGTGGASKLKGAIDHILQLCANLDTWCIMSPRNHRPQLQELSPQHCKQYDLCQRRSWGWARTGHHCAQARGQGHIGGADQQEPCRKLTLPPDRTPPSHPSRPPSRAPSSPTPTVRGFMRRSAPPLGAHSTDVYGNPRTLLVQDPFADKLKNLMDQVHNQLEMPELSRDFGTQMYEQQVVELSQTAAEAGLQQRRVYALHLRRYNDALLIHDTVRAVDALATLQDFYDRERATKTQVLRAERWLLALFDGHKNELARLATHGPENPKLEVLEQILRKQFGSSESPRGIIFTRTRQSTHSLLLWLQHQPGLQTVDIRAQLLTGAGNSSQSTHMTQARGRARAGQSVYSFVATENSRELRRELTNEALEALMEKAVAAVQEMDQAEYQAKIRDLQRAAVVKRAARAAQQESRRQQFLADQVQLLCINCMVAVGHGSDLRKVEGTHHVNVNPNFSIYYKVSQQPVVMDRAFKDWRPGGAISCGNCGEAWGMQIIYKSVKLPVIKVCSMLLETPQGRVRAKKWSRVPFLVPDFDYLQHCAQSLSDLFLD
ncbi:ATP-dependent RNA helicase DHX58 isoform X2 [Diceros bicornis minor]|uniref:ATP-dependent RNA helicase DHX58 isoform X2 n=1 Tax=Diceros bicornis minor TaxID=77932 RepID=UPI0026EBA73A|nr:ATP-dependent RNA helicase DHX58 isoform X2 [Diceros bicornis minor]